MNNNIVVVYVEPTPYIMDIAFALEKKWKGKIVFFFLAENLTQNWNIPLKKNYKILPKNNFKKLIFFIKEISSNQYKYVHLAGWGSPILILFILISKMKRLFVTVESDTPYRPYTKYWKRSIKLLMYPIIFRFINLFLTGGSRQTKYIERYGVKINKIIPVQMTIDIQTIQKYSKTLDYKKRKLIREKYDILEKEIVLLYVGRLEIYKGITDLINAFNKIKSNLARLLIIGDGTLSNYIYDSIRENNKISYAGRLSGNDLIDMYFAADFLILPSHSESWGLVINEAMAMQLPVIASDRVGCVDDLVNHNKTGLIFKAKQIDELKSAMQHLIDNQEKRLRMGCNAKEEIANWTLENEASKICQAWQRLESV